VRVCDLPCTVQRLALALPPLGPPIATDSAAVASSLVVNIFANIERLNVPRLRVIGYRARFKGAHTAENIPYSWKWKPVFDSR
jgi:hypothetical protein